MSQPGTCVRQRPSPARGPRGCTSLAPGAIPWLCSSVFARAATAGVLSWCARHPVQCGL